jgi:hypothetical protein
VSFSDDIRRFAEKTKLRMDLVHRKVVFDLTSSVVSMSPVKTGRFRNNWNIAEGEPNTSTRETVGDPTDRLKGYADTINLGGVVYITNSLPYAIPLEYGWSKQAPHGMVRVTITNYQQYMANAVRSLPR